MGLNSFPFALEWGPVGRSSFDPLCYFLALASLTHARPSTRGPRLRRRKLGFTSVYDGKCRENIGFLRKSPLKLTKIALNFTHMGKFVNVVVVNDSR